MLIVTAVSGSERAGCLVGFSTQTSIHPPRYLVCVSRKNRTFDVVCAAQRVAVHFLGQDQRPLAELFGGETGDEVDKFEQVPWSPGPGGLPLLEGVPGRFVASVLERLDLGDHVGLLVEPQEAVDGGGALDLGFQSVKAIEPGHSA